MESRPDEEERTAAAIDAIAGPLAIEHTSIDPVDGQRRDGVRFMEVVADLEREIGSTLGFRLGVTFPYEGITTGQNWSAMRSALKKWILEESPSLPDGHRTVRLPEFPFEVHIDKSGRTPALTFRRFWPEERDLAERLRALIDRKASKLGAHQSAGRVTVLIIESDDIALMNDEKLRAGISSAFPNGLPTGIDELWYADTSVPGEPLFFEFANRRRPVRESE